MRQKNLIQAQLWAEEQGVSWRDTWRSPAGHEQNARTPRKNPPNGMGGGGGSGPRPQTETETETKQLSVPPPAALEAGAKSSSTLEVGGEGP